MQRKDKKASDPEFTVNHHKHPEVGGMGHISLQVKDGDETFELNTYPDTTKRSLSLIPSFLTFFTFPTKAFNPPINDPGCSPITESYKIPAEMLPDPHAALAKMQEIRASADSGSMGFSVTPNTVTQAIYANLLSSKVNTSELHIGLKMLDRERFDQANKVKVTNCADSTHQVLNAGGFSKPADVFSYHTPSGINDFFKSHSAVAKIDTEVKQQSPSHSPRSSIE